MFGSVILDVVIGLLFVYLLLSMACSALTELIASRLDLRAKVLETGIRNLLSDPSATGLAKTLYNHPLIRTLALPGRKPSYIPSSSFALALMSILTAGGTDGESQQPGSAVVSSGQLDSQVAGLLRFLTEQAGNDVGKVQQSLQDWYNNAMERVSGWYKRKVQVIIFFLGAVVTVATNTDTLQVTDALSRSSNLRASVVTAAQTYVRQQPRAREEMTPAPEQSAGEPDTRGVAPLVPAVADARSGEERMQESLRAVQNLGLPIGWKDSPQLAEGDPHKWPGGFTSYRAWGHQLRMHWLGWLLTAVAISQGAPFWFDLLNKAVRTSVKPSK